MEKCFLEMAHKIKLNLDKEEQVGVMSYTGSKTTRPLEKNNAKKN